MLACSFGRCPLRLYLTRTEARAGPDPAWRFFCPGGRVLDTGYRVRVILGPPGRKNGLLNGFGGGSFNFSLLLGLEELNFSRGVINYAERQQLAIDGSSDWQAGEGAN